MRDEFVALVVESEQNRVAFLRTELSLCSTLLGLAATEHETGHQEAAERSFHHAAEAHATVMRFLLDPQHASHLTTEQLQEFTERAHDLRKTADSLQEMVFH